MFHYIIAAFFLILGMSMNGIAYKAYRAGEVKLWVAILGGAFFSAAFGFVVFLALQGPERERLHEEFLRRNHACIKKLVGGGSEIADAEEVCRREEQYKKEKEEKQ